MKQIITFFAALLIAMAAFAQTGINYKAIVKDVNGNIIANQDIAVKFELQYLDIDSYWATDYREIHNTTTDNNGIIILNIGEGDVLLAGEFPTTNWIRNYSLNTEIDIENDGTFVNLGRTSFKKVPMAIHAARADVATTAFSATTATTATTALNVTGLEALDEGNGIGWRLKGRDPALYGPIGNNAVDLSYSNTLTPYGAIGHYATAMGIGTTASGSYSTAMGSITTASSSSSTAMGQSTTASGSSSTAMGNGSKASGSSSTAMGYNTTASGSSSTAMGRSTTARSAYETAIGAYTTNELPLDSINWNTNDRLFVIGNGTSNTLRSNALTVLKNGKTGINTSTPASLFEVAHLNSSTENGTPQAQSLSILNKDTNNSWQFHTTSYLNLYRNGVFRGSWNATSGAYVQASDRRVKKNITPLESGTLNKLLQLNPVSYLMIDQTDTKRNLGLISQEVQAIFPSITHYVEESDLLTLSYTELIPILIKALQEQQAIIEAQNSQLKNQDTKINGLTAELTELKTLDQRVKQLENILKTLEQ